MQALVLLGAVGPPIGRALLRAAVALGLTSSLGAVHAAMRPAALPFGIGEQLTFAVTTTHTGTVGKAVMSLTGPVDVRGTPTMVASFETHISVALMKGSNVSRSWIEEGSMTSLRFAKHERRPFSTNTDSVDVFPELHRWTGPNGASGTVTSDHPLDELSFIYFLRTIDFAPDSTYSFDRHYDAHRNPTTVRVVKHETLTTPAGTFHTTELEMRVKDASVYKGEGVLHFWLSDDSCHLPIRIQSTMPILGTGVLTLESAATPSCRAGEAR